MWQNRLDIRPKLPLQKLFGHSARSRLQHDHVVFLGTPKATRTCSSPTQYDLNVLQVRTYGMFDMLFVDIRRRWHARSTSSSSCAERS